MGLYCELDTLSNACCYATVETSPGDPLMTCPPAESPLEKPTHHSEIMPLMGIDMKEIERRMLQKDMPTKSSRVSINTCFLIGRLGCC